MRRIANPLILAFALLAAGWVSWTLGQAQERIARAKTQIATLEYDAVADDESELDRALRYAARVPGAGNDISCARRDARATAEYWLARYDGLVLERDAGGAPVEHDPELLLLAANAAYRSTRFDGVDRDTAVERLETLVRNYADVLKSDPGNSVLIDAAYNYELTARIRDTLERVRANAPLPSVPPPPPSSVHGRQGGPPKNVDKNQFRVVIPKRSDERNQDPEGGQGQQRIRKG
jgi:hypothetical protein